MKLFSISVGLVLVCVAFAGALLFIQNQQPKNFIENYREPVKNLSQDGKYVNSEFGFEIKYPPISETYLGSCESYKDNKNTSVPVKVFSDPGNKTIYITNSVTVEVQNKQNSDGSYGYDWSRCKTVPTTLRLIKNGFSNGLPEQVGNITYPVAMKFMFGKASDDKTLIKMGERMHGATNCEIASKKFVKGTKDTYEISLRGQGEAGEPGGSCWINAAYQFLYSPNTKTAVVGSGYQNCFFGSDKECVAKAKLFD